MAAEGEGRPSFCVIGAGIIIGLSTAYALAKHFRGCRLAIVYDKCSPDTTSNDGFGICSIRGLGELDNPHAIRWTKLTTGYCEDIIRKSPDTAKAMGVSAVNACLIFDKKRLNDGTSGPHWDTFSFSRKLDEDSIDSLQLCIEELGHVFERKFVAKEDLEVYNAGTWVIDTNAYLPWMKKELESMHVKEDISRLQFLKKRINDFSEVMSEDYDLFVNCSGLGSKFLVPDDKVIPIRGQYVEVDATEQNDLRYGHQTYICPKSGHVALGAVYQLGRFDTVLDPSDRDDILRRCFALNPKLRQSCIINEGVGIRPGRFGGARVEMEIRRFGSPALPKPLIHNYGHGPRGIMQHWGCALEVVKFAETYLKQTPNL